MFDWISKQLFSVKDVIENYAACPCFGDREVKAMAPKPELEKLAERIGVNSAKIAALRQQRATVHPVALKEHDQQIDRLERWNAIQKRLLLLLQEDYGTLT